MTHSIKRAAVIGSGVMGSGIAAHLANAGIPVYLLDLPTDTPRNKLAEEAIERLLKTEPAPLVHKRCAKLITPGNIEDDLSKLAECDWVIEAVVEKLEVKQALYEKLEKVMKPTAVISSNTSTIPLALLTQGRSELFQKNFVITHFFNPPRYTQLLEIVKSPQTDPEILKTIEDFCDKFLGKGLVRCHDTPGFIGNRIGTFWLLSALNHALEKNISVEAVDAVFGRPLGLPKTGVFGLLDLVGIDLVPLIGASMLQNLPKEDTYHRIYKDHDFIKKMIADGYTGRKGKGGFYRLNKQGISKTKETLNLKTGEYSKTKVPHLPLLQKFGKNLQALFSEKNDPISVYAWAVVSEVLVYAASLVPEIADDIVSVDQAMKLGYNWTYGPFELIDKIGPAWFVQKLKEEGRFIPPLLDSVADKTFYRLSEGSLEFQTVQGQYSPFPQRKGHLSLDNIKLSSKPLAKNASAALWDVGDGVVCLEFTSKMNSIDPAIMQMIYKAIEIVQTKYKALVIYNEGKNFSAGVNLGLALFVANVGAWSQIQDIVDQGQKAYTALKFSPFPVVGAPSGMALGGGCEILLHCDAIQAHVESYMGLVETGVGIIPAWGGCKEMLQRWLAFDKRPGGFMPAISKVFEFISTARVSKSAMESQEMLILRKGDGITMNRGRLLADAKEKALLLWEGYIPPAFKPLHLPGAGAKTALDLAVGDYVKAGKATAYDKVVLDKLSTILTGGDTDQYDEMTEQDLLMLEIEAFMALIKNEKTLARMEYILETGKPLRN